MPDPGKVDSTDSAKAMSRRRWLQAAGIAGLGGVAGCLGGDDGDETPTEGPGNGDTPTDTPEDGNGDTPTDTPEDGNGSGGTAMDPMWNVAGLNDPPSEMHFNEYNLAQRPPRGYVWDVLAEMHYGLDDGFFYPVLLDEWNFDEDELTFTMTLKESTWWHNDEPVSSQDIWCMCMLEYYNREALHAAVDPDPDNFEIVDDKTLRVHFAGETNPTLVEQQLTTRRLRAYSHFGDWADSIAENLDDQDHYEEVMEEIAQARIEDRIGNSLWKIVDATRTEFTSEIHEGHYNGDLWLDNGAEGASIEFASSDRERQLAFSGEIDAVGGIDEAILSNIPDYYERFDTPQEASFGLGLNMNLEPYDDVRVRKAILYAIDRESVAENTGLNHSPVGNITGISATENVYIDDVDQYPAYEHDPDRAVELLEDAGLSQDGGEWYLENGDRWTMEMVFTSPHVEGGHTVNSQLQDFGIETEFRTVDAGPFYGDIWTGIAEQEIDAWMMWWGGWRPYPTNGLSAALVSTRHDNIGYPGFEDNGGEVDVPMPIGNPDGDMETIDLVGLFNDVASSADAEANKEKIQLAAWVFNQTLPELPMTNRFSVNWINGRDFNVPADDSPHRLCNIPANTLPGTGDIYPRTE